MIGSTAQNEERVEDMGFFSRHQNQPELPSDIISMMERFGRFEFDPQGSSEDEARAMGSIEPKLFPFASTDPEGFLVALAEAVLPVGGWAAYGAERIIWSLLGQSFSQRPLYKAIMSSSLEFLRTNGVPPMRLNDYEWNHWLDSGGTIDTWISRRPIPSPEEAPISELQPGETRRVTQLTSEPDSSMILVRRDGEGRYCALIDNKWSDEDPHRVQRVWKSTESLYELYIQIGLAMQVPTYWYDRELEPYFPLPRPRI